MAFNPNSLAQLDLPSIDRAAQQNALGTSGIQRQGEFNALAPQIARGDQGAARQGLALDPQQTQQILQGIAALEEPERQRLRQQTENAAKSLVALKSLPPEQRQAGYQQWLQLAGQNRWIDESDAPPEQYDDFWVDSQISEALTLDDMIKQATPLSGPGKVQTDINRGILPQGTPLSSSGVNVNVGGGQDFGKPPKDFVWAREADGSIALRQDPETGFSSPIAVPVAGGPAAAKREAVESAAANKETQRTIQAQVVTQDIDRAIKAVEDASVPVTGVGSFLSFVPGTTAKDLSANLDTIKANIGFDKLQSMRDASPTGGALGQVSEFENRLLQSVFGALDQAQSKEQFLFNMKRLKETYLDVIHGPGNRPEQAEEQGSAPTATNPQTGEKIIFRNGKWEPVQ